MCIHFQNRHTSYQQLSHSRHFPQVCLFFRTLAVGRVTTTLHVCSLHLEAQSKVQMAPHELKRRYTPVYMETPLFSTYKPEKTEGAYNLRVRKQTAQKERASGQRTLNSVTSTLLGSNNQSFKEKKPR